MVSDREENVYHGIMFEDWYFMEESVDFNDGESDEGCEDVVNLLPNDPFGMEFNLGLRNDPSRMDFNITLPRDPFGMEFDIKATVATIAGWMEDCGLTSYGFETDEASSGDQNAEDNKFFAELNFVWTSSLRCEQEQRQNVFVDAGSVMHSDDESCDRQDVLGGYIDEFMCFGCEKYQNENVKLYDNSSGGAPADALLFALNYIIDIRDLLSVERVCKSLRDSVRNDPLLWRNIHIDYSLSDKITNDDLLQLTNRAQGSLRSLSLVKCLKITNVGLKNVLEKNPGLTKLSVPGCIKLSVDGVLQDLKVFNSGALPGIRHLRIGELFGLTNQHFNELKLLLGVDQDKKSSSKYKPRFYQAGQVYLSLDDDRVLDIETCPMCEKARQVYDCPAESCKVKVHSTKMCRACTFCIARCISCGCCLDNKAYEETFSLDLLCLDCLTDLLGCQDSVAISPRHTYFHQKASYHFFLYS